MDDGSRLPWIIAAVLVLCAAYCAMAETAFASASRPKLKVAAEAGKKEDVDAAVAELLKNEGAKKGKNAKLGGEDFTVVTYTDAKDKRAITAYVGLGGGSLASITLKGIAAGDEDAAAILRSISFKSMEARKITTTTTTKAAKPTGVTTPSAMAAIRSIAVGAH